MNCIQWAKKNQSLLSYAEARYVFLNILDLKEQQFDQKLSEQQLNKLESILVRLRTEEPFAYIVENSPFMGRDFYVDRRVLIPRPETEGLVDLATQMVRKPSKILECCTGSGAIAISLKHFFPQCQLQANDISEPALKMAQRNAKDHEVDILFAQQDVLSSAFWDKDSDKEFDLIISNPPYISSVEYRSLDKSVKDFEPKIALQAEEDGLVFYRTFAENAHHRLSKNGLLLAEIGYEQGLALLKLYKSNGWSVEVKKDLFGKDRFLVATKN